MKNEWEFEDIEFTIWWKKYTETRPKYDDAMRCYCWDAFKAGKLSQTVFQDEDA